MSRQRPDVATLDALVLGTDGPEERTAWEWLVATPGSAGVWAEAVTRRTEVDQFAALLDSHPWIALVMERIRRLVGARAGLRLEVDLGGDALLASLGAAEEEPTVRVTPAWGRIEPVSVRLGTVAELRVMGTTLEKTRIFYKSSSGAEGLLARGRWRLESAEAPVLLVACMAEREPSTLDEALASATAVAGVLLMEEPSE